MGRKKNPETLEKERKKIEKEIGILSKILEAKEKEISLTEKIKKLQATIREDLMNQLEKQGKVGKHFEDMVDDYVYNVKLKALLQNDIDTNGIRYITTTGNGYDVFKPNESIPNLHKTNGQMLKILSDLELKEPEIGDDESGDEGDDLL